jgi:hypothetical protein
MASTNMIESPSSPLSSVPSNFDRSEPSTPQKLHVKRKTAELQITNGRSTRRRKTQDNLQASLDQLQSDIISRAQNSESVAPVTTIKPAARAKKKTAATRKGARSSATIVASNEAGELDPARDQIELNPLASSVVDAYDPAFRPELQDSAEGPSTALVAAIEASDEPESSLFDHPTSGYTLLQLENELAAESYMTSPPRRKSAGSKPLPEMTASPPVASGVRELQNEHVHEKKVTESILQHNDLETSEPQPRESSRPTRRRVQSSKVDDGFGMEEVKAVASTKRKGQPLRGNWSVQHLLSNPKSKLATCGLNVSDVTTRSLHLANTF